MPSFYNIKVHSSITIRALKRAFLYLKQYLNDLIRRQWSGLQIKNRNKKFKISFNIYFKRWSGIITDLVIMDLLGQGGQPRYNGPRYNGPLTVKNPKTKFQKVFFNF